VRAEHGPPRVGERFVGIAGDALSGNATGNDRAILQPGE